MNRAEITRQQKNEAITAGTGWIYDTTRMSQGENGFRDSWWLRGGRRYTNPPDYFAKTPDGAMAREEAMSWLMERSCEIAGINTFCLPGRAGYMYNVAWNLDLPENVLAQGDTLPEAIAESLYAAVVAMEAENASSK
jgi:hypothetical protein